MALVRSDELARYEGHYVDVAPRNELQRIVTTLRADIASRRGSTA